jgi:hypothetical protein
MPVQLAEKKYICIVLVRLSISEEKGCEEKVLSAVPTDLRIIRSHSVYQCAGTPLLTVCTPCRQNCCRTLYDSS